MMTIQITILIILTIILVPLIKIAKKGDKELDELRNENLKLKEKNLRLKANLKNSNKNN